MRKALAIGLLGLMVLPVIAEAGGDYEAKAEVRHRFELNDKDFNSDTKLSSYSLLRSRLGVGFEPAEGVTAFLQVQDSRVFGTETSTLNDGSADAIDMHQAVVRFTDLFGKPVDVSLGRQEVSLGPQRLVGAVGWHNIGRSLDGIIVTPKFDKGAVSIFNFIANEGMVDTDPSEEVSLIPAPGDVGDIYVSGIWGAIDAVEGYSINPHWIWVRDVGLYETSLHTLGLYAKKGGKLHHETEVAFQTGKSGSGDERVDVSALMAALNVGMSFPDAAGKPDVTVGVDYLSGNDPDKDDEIGVFNTLLATNHKYYGFMDYFLNIPTSTQGLGLMDMHVRASMKAGEKSVVKLAAHMFQSAEEATLADDEKSSAFGQEVDFTFKHMYNKSCDFMFGVSVFMPGDIFKDDSWYGQEDMSTWAYLMTTVRG